MSKIIEAISLICENHNVRVTLKSSMMAGGIAGLSTVAGAVVSKSFIKYYLINNEISDDCIIFKLMGPPGILVGAVVGGLYSFNKYRGSFKSAAVIIRDELTEEQKEQLVGHLVEAFRGFSTRDAVAFVAILMTDQTLVVSKVTDYLTSLGMKIID